MATSNSATLRPFNLAEQYHTQNCYLRCFKSVVVVFAVFFVFVVVVDDDVEAFAVNVVDSRIMGKILSETVEK